MSMSSFIARLIRDEFGPVPTITVSLNAASSKTKLPFKFFFLPFAAIDIPQVTTTITREATHRRLRRSAGRRSSAVGADQFIPSAAR